MRQKQQLKTLKGFRDFLPQDAKKRQYVRSVIKNTFELFGFEPLETPALEYEEVLLGKYGKEADKLVYTFKDKGGRKVALRYDQTVPTARVLACNKKVLPNPWRRYQIQNVWRADKPQKGRYRQFLQCDVDIFGTTSLIAEAEIITVSVKALSNLGFDKTNIFLNDRKILFSIMQKAGIEQSDHLSIIQSIDKLDKKPQQEVKQEISKKGLNLKQIQTLFSELDKAKLTERLRSVIDISCKLGIKKSYFKFRPYLARGLDYYTSTIFEIAIEGYDGGSVAGGGRYDHLIKKLSGMAMPAVGIAFGFDRLIDAMQRGRLFKNGSASATVFVSIFSPELIECSLKTTLLLRSRGIKTELFPDENTPLPKQLKMADKKRIPYVVIIGPDEEEKKVIILKDMKTGKQESLTEKEMIKRLKKSKNFVLQT